MQIAIIGAGRVGLCLGASLAEKGSNIIFIDKDEQKIKELSQQKFGFYELNLEETLKKHWSQLQWSHDLQQAQSCKFLFLSLSTKILEQGQPDLLETFKLCEKIARQNQNKRILIIKSTFPVGSQRKISDLTQKHNPNLHIVSCPEFLKQGQALQDIKEGYRLVIGSRDKKIAQQVEELYKTFYKGKIIHSNPETAEMSKLASNSFLALKISFINELSRFCEKFNIQKEDLKTILGADKRIAPEFLESGLGFGGSCLPKDLNMLVEQAQSLNVEMNLLQTTQQINTGQVDHFLEAIKHAFPTLKGRHFAFWGLSFKEDTDDVRCSPALNLAQKLLNEGCELKVYDPLISKKDILALFENQKNLQVYENLKDSLSHQEALIVANKSKEFLSLSLKEIKQSLKNPFIVDARNLFLAEELVRAGFDFYQAGQSGNSRTS